MPVRVLVFAVDFASPWMLAGLALAAIPVLLHLFYQRRYRETEWAAMRFLLAAARKNSRRMRLEQLLLLAVRTLVFVCLVLALARPFMAALGRSAVPDIPTHRIIVLDASLSMGAQPDEITRFERGKQLARQIVAAARPGDALNLVRIAETTSPAVIRRPTFRRDQVETELDRVQLTQEWGDLSAALRVVEELVRGTQEISRKEVYLISDFQRSGWSDAAGGRAAVRQLFDRISQRAEVLLLDVGQPRTPNVAVTRFSPVSAGSLGGGADRAVLVGRPVFLQAVLRNFGDEPISRQRVELHAGGRLVQTRIVDLPAGTETSVDFEYTFSGDVDRPAPFDATLEVRLPDDFLPADNRRWLVLPVRERLDVLLVDGKPSGREMWGGTDHLKLALAPGLSEDRWTGTIRPHVISDGELAGADLSRYDCVFLCNVRLFTPAEAAQLTAYCQAGGVVVISLGEQVRTDNYNQVLYRDGAGILPARLGAVQGGATGDAAYEFDSRQYQHPLVAAFRGNPNAGLESTRTFTYVKAVLPADSDAKVALWYSSGDPAIIEAAAGRGRCILVTTAFDRNWGTWVVWPSFPPMMHELVYFAASADARRRNLEVGDLITERVAARAAALTADVVGPDGMARPVPLDDEAGTSRLMYEGTGAPGVYTVRFQPPPSRELLFAVNVDPRESDLAKMSESELHVDWLAGIDFAYRTNWTDRPRDAETAVGARSSVSRLLLWTALLLLYVEQAMAWRFWWGFLLLYVLVACGFVYQVAIHRTPLAVLAAVIFAAGMVGLVSLRHRLWQEPA